MFQKYYIVPVFVPFWTSAANICAFKCATEGDLFRDGWLDGGCGLNILWKSFCTHCHWLVGEKWSRPAATAIRSRPPAAYFAKLSGLRISQNDQIITANHLPLKAKFRQHDQLPWLRGTTGWCWFGQIHHWWLLPSLFNWLVTIVSFIWKFRLSYSRSVENCEHFWKDYSFYCPGSPRYF